MKNKKLFLTGLILCVAMVASTFLIVAYRQTVYAVSANITLTGDVATIEVDTTVRTATKDNANRAGWLVNSGTNNVFLSYTLATPPTTNAQKVGVIMIPPNATIPVNRSFPTFTYVAGASTSVLLWFPED